MDLLKSSNQHFQHQAVGDLAWSISSPPLISQPQHRCTWPDSQWYRCLYQQALPWLNELDNDPSGLLTFLSEQKDRRLGKYFETLWFYWLKHNPRYEIVENNVQIIIDGETLGEIDFIVFDKTVKKTIHWEMAVKFYLGEGDTRDMCNWHGPNLRDRLDIKVNHLLHIQSSISNNLRISRWLRQQKILIDECAVILKGRLYYPWRMTEHLYQQSGSLSAVTPSECSTDLLFGCWFNPEDFDEKFDETQRFTPLLNEGWMEKKPTNSFGDTYSKTGIFKTISKNILRFPLHLQVHNPYHSFDRVFIVDKNWPHNTA